MLEKNEITKLITCENQEFIEESLEDALKSKSVLSFFEVFKDITKLAIPMGLSFTFSFEVFLAILMLNHLGSTTEETAAVTLVSILMNTICVLACSPLFAVAIDLSNKLGDWKKTNAEEEDIDTIAEKKEAIASTNVNSLLIATAVAIPAFLGLFFSDGLLASVFQQNHNVTAIAGEFLRPYSFAVPFLAVRTSFEQIMFGFGKTKPAMWIGLASLLLGGGLAFLLGFGAKIGSLQIPRLGSPGIAIGFIVESCITALGYGFYIALQEDCREFAFFSKLLDRLKNHNQHLKNILKTGGAIAFTVALELAMVLAVGIFSGLVGVTEQSAMAFNMQFLYFIFIALAAFSFSCTQEISRAIGEKNYGNANSIAKYGLLTTLIYLTPIPVFLAAYPKALTLIAGGTEDNVANILKILVPVMSFGVIIDAVRYNLLQQSRAFGDLFAPNVIAALGLGSGVVLSGCLGLKTPLGIYGVAMGYTIGITLAALPLLLRWLHKIQNLDPNVERSPSRSWGSFFKSPANPSINSEHIEDYATPSTPSITD